MAGQAIVTIRVKQWSVDIANSFWELVRGLGGITELTPGTGMLFDLGWEQHITVTTKAMLFPLDIAFISESMVVKELIQYLVPGQRLTAVFPARYFLEVNAGEMGDIDLGDQVSISPLTIQGVNELPDWMNMLFPLIGLAMMGLFIVGVTDEIGDTGKV